MEVRDGILVGISNYDDRVPVTDSDRTDGPRHAHPKGAGAHRSASFQSTIARSLPIFQSPNRQQSANLPICQSASARIAQPLTHAGVHSTLTFSTLTSASE
jgi:hypothetical protein